MEGGETHKEREEDTQREGGRARKEGHRQRERESDGGRDALFILVKQRALSGSRHHAHADGHLLTARARAH